MNPELLRMFVIGLIVVPLVGAVVAGMLGSRQGKLVRGVSLLATLLTLVLAVVLSAHFLGLPGRQAEDEGTLSTFQPEFVPGATENEPNATTWEVVRLGPGSVQFYLGLDGLNVWLVALTALLMVSSVLVSWKAVDERVNEYYAWLLALGAGMFGVFLAFDIVIFYVFFELTLVPLFFLIGIWGGPQRQTAAVKFFIYTLAGSLITLLGVLAVILTLYSRPGGELTFSIPRLVTLMQGQLDRPEERAFWLGFQAWVFLALLAGFAIKVPLVPVHTWLPLAHVEAPTAGSVLLAGVLLKIGSYGFLRLCLTLTPDAALHTGVPLIGVLSVVGIIYGAFCALAQDDIKKLVAYSSVSHLGFCMLGMFALNEAGLAGSLLQMINHGLSTGALFLLVGMLYERYHTRKIAAYGGMAARLKLLGFFMVVACLSSVGLPGLNGFIGEALVFFGMYGLWDDAPIDGRVLVICGAFGIVLGAWYLMTLLRAVYFGQVKEPEHEGHAIHDLDGREITALAPIAVLFLLLGLYPQPLLDSVNKEVKLVAGIAAKAHDRRAADMQKAPAPVAQGENVNELAGE